jgi:hypothetical protein
LLRTGDKTVTLLLEAKRHQTKNGCSRKHPSTEQNQF